MISKYESYSPDQLEELFSNMLIDSWSFSKVASFSRNEKDFEMRYIYNYPYKVSASNVAGSAYHKALQVYFENFKENIRLDIVDLQTVAFEYIENTHANQWKIQKTTPTVEECIIKATKTVTALLQNFYTELDTYIFDITQVLHVEQRVNTWLVVNGVDIPLPCHMEIDLVIKTADDRIVLIDHKSKAAFSDEQELSFVMGKQAITYVLGYEKLTNLTVDEVWFIENKPSKNKDKSPQLKPLKIKLDKDQRKLYEALLYEPLKRMIEAVSDPDYVYMINDNDTFIDKAELYEFWSKTLIAEVDEFNIPDSKKELIERRNKKIRNAAIASINPKVITDFKKQASSFITYNYNNKNMTKQEKIEHILLTFGISVKVTHEFKGFSSDTFLLDIGVGVKVANVMARKMDIANALDVSSVRINENLFVYDNKSYISIEVSKRRETSLPYDEKYLNGYKIPIGISNFNDPVIWDLDNHSTPHMLICGATGSGKSVSLISTINYALAAGIDDIILLDPKYEFTQYSNIVNVVQDIEDIEVTMSLLVDEMNERAKTGQNSKRLIVFDEFADAVANSRKGAELKVYENIEDGCFKDGRIKYKRTHTDTLKSLEENLKILLQKGRSLGFRIIAATQRASVKVITGDAKVNFPVQVCFRVPKDIDSKVVLGESGAESLAGQGDGLMRSPEYLNIVRFQGFYKS